MKTVCICGTNLLTRHLVNFNLDADYWYQNESYSAGTVLENHWTTGKPCHGVFQMHAPPIWKSDNSGRHPGHFNWLKKTNIPVWMQEHFEDVPASRKYPLEEITAALLPNLTRNDGDLYESAAPYFTSTTAYMLALAIYQGYQQIYLYGIEMASDTEYVRQRDGVTFWIGVAIGRGINVVLQKKSLLMAGPLYGYTGEIVIDKQQFEMACAALDQKIEETKTKSFQAKGTAEAQFRAIFSAKSPEDAEKAIQLYLASANEVIDAAFNYGVTVGGYSENARYIKQCDELIAAAGGEKALEALVKK